jgi:AcrR family transcriptional regulator
MIQVGEAGCVLAMPQVPDARASRFPRRTLRREETRARIVAAASRLFRQVGYADATMASIADAADVHVATLFTHFKTKAELAATLGEAAIAELAGLIAKAQGELPFFAFFRGVVLGAAQTYQDNSGPNIAFGHELRRDPELAYGWLIYQQRQIEMLANYIASDYGLDLVEDNRPMLVASLLVASNTLTHDRWLDSQSALGLIDETLKSIELTQKMAEAILPHR